MTNDKWNFVSALPGFWSEIPSITDIYFSYFNDNDTHLRFLFLGENFNKNNFQITNTSNFLLDLIFLMKILILRFLLNNKNVVSKYNLSFYTLFSQNKQSAEDVIVLSAYQVIPSDIFPMSNLRTLFSFRPNVTKAATMLTLCNWDQLKMSKRKSIKKEPTRKHSIYFFSDILFNWDNI